MMNQTKKHTTGKKLLALLLALIMTVSLLPMSVFAAEPGAEETPVVEGQTQPAAETGADDAEQAQEPDADEADEGEEDAVLPGDAEGDADDADVADDGIAAFAATDATDKESVVIKMDSNNLAIVEQTAAYTAPTESGFRAVMLDCGRKYFTVQQIEKLIDFMKQYGYNQLQLSFGNGGCRFLLDKMELKYSDGETTTTISADGTTQTNIKQGNTNFNGNGEYLSQSDMDKIIGYATKKGITIVPMLNMPGHATAIAYGHGNGNNLDITNNDVRRYAFALLKKYVDYFADNGCKYFNFGADEFSSGTSTEFSTFINSCANIIKNAGMTPRMFNDGVTAGNVSTDIQICHWTCGWSGHYIPQASTLKNNGYPLINTAGDWYYVVKDYKDSEAAETNKYNVYGDKAALVELPTLKGATKNTLNEYMTLNGKETVNGGLGTMFCIWCDNSTVVPSDTIISEDANYGALYQLKALAETYWPDDIDTSGGDTGDTVTEKTVKLEVGQTSAPYEVTGTVTGNEKTGDEYIATANVTTGTAQTASIKQITDANYAFSADKKYLIVNQRTGNVLTQRSGTWNGKGGLTLSGTASATNANWWKITGTNDSYTISYNGKTDKYLTLGDNTASLGSTDTTMMLSYTDNEAVSSAYTGYWNISYNNYYYFNNLGGEQVAGGWHDATGTYDEPTDEGSKWAIYEITEETTGGNTLTITGTGEGNTEVTVGNTKYIIEVTAPTKTETKTVAPNGTTTLQPEVPEDGSVTYTLSTEDNTANVTLDASTGVVTASETTGTATVTAVVKNAGEKVVARYTYTITVSDIDWSTVEPLSVELWVTNLPIGKDENSNTESWNELNVSKTGNTTTCTPASIKLQPEDVYAAGGEAGVELLSQVISGGVAFDGDGEVATYNNEPIKYVYWKGVVLQNGLKQYHGNSAYPHDDCSDKGVDFEMIRYTAGGWQYYANNTWNFVKDDDTLIAYYMQKFVVSDEVTTTTRDWGKIAGDGGATDSNAFNWAAPAPTGYFGVGYAVVYSDKSMSPSTEQGIWNETLQMRYCYDPGVKSSDPGYILAYDTENYKITKVTITRGYHADSDGNQITESKRIWNKDEQVLWNKIMNDAGDQWYDETVIWDAATGTRNDHNAIVLDPTIWGNTWVTKDKNNEAFLILFYVEEVQKDTNLKLVYWDDNANQQINPKEIQISVKDGVTFTNGLCDGSGKVIGDKGSWNSADKNNNDYLPDDAYIINSVDRPQQFNKNITILEGVAANYCSGIYKYVKAGIIDDGKTLVLHYNLKNVAKKTYVVDFGLTVNITGLKELFNVTSMTTDGYMSLASANKLTDSKGNYGRAVIDTTTWDSMTYTLFRMIDSEVQIPLYLNIKQDNGKYVQQSTFISVIPASNVYYEDSFASFYDAGSTEAKTTFTATIDASNEMGKWYVDNSDNTALSNDVTQALEALGDKKNVYGYDPAYDNCTMFSMGSAKKVTVSADMVNNWNENSDAWPTAQFTFKGTGFDVISLTDNKSGLLICKVVDVATGEIKYNKFVNDYYGYGYVGGKWIKVDKDAANALYQLPVVKVDGLPYSEYTVTLTVGYSALFDNANRGSYSFWLDGVRIYDPAGKTLDETYAKDHEGWPKYIELHDELVKTTDATVKHGFLFIEGNEQAELANYTSYGPNHEVYLLPGQTIAFKLDNVSNVDKVQIGAKAPMGSAALKVNGNEAKPITTATEMYYDITEYAISGEGTNKTSQTVTITNGGDAGTILSLTQLKVTHKADGTQASLAILNENEREQVVQMVRAMYAPVEPEVFAPERFEASWNRSTVKVGQRATLTVKTSTDVDVITVDGVTVTNYRTRTQRTGWGWNATKVTYREFTYTITAAEAGTLDYSVVAVNADGVSSEPITAALTVQAVQRPQRPSWLDKIFSRWF